MKPRLFAKKNTIFFVKKKIFKKKIQFKLIPDDATQFFVVVVLWIEQSTPQQQLGCFFFTSIYSPNIYI